jgi:hypothetical protein
MKPTKTPGAFCRGTEGNGGKTFADSPLNTPKPDARLPKSAGRSNETRPPIKLTPLHFNGQNWGWLARTDKNTFCWGFTRAQAYHRLRPALNARTKEE